MSNKEHFKSRRLCLILAQAFIWFILLALTGCSSLIFPTEEIDRAITSFDRAIASLAQESADWRVVVTDLQEEITEDMRSTIRNEVENLTRNAVLTAGGELRCNAEFMRIKLERELRRIRNNFARDLNTVSVAFWEQPLIPLLPETPPEPFICHSVPSAVDLHVEADRRVKLDIFGFDLRSMPITAHLITQGQLSITQGTLSPAEFKKQIEKVVSKRPKTTALAAPQMSAKLEARSFVLQRPNSWFQKDISSALAVISDFHAVLDLTESGVEITPNSKTIALSWNGVTHSYIPVLAHQQVLECKNVTGESSASEQTFMPPFKNHNQCDDNPDREFGGNGPCVHFDMYLYMDAAKQKIIARYFMEAYECKRFGIWDGNCTWAYGWDETTLFIAEDNQKILSFDVEREIHYSYRDDDDHVDEVSYGGREPVRYLDFTGDDNGPDVEHHTGVDIGFRKINVTLEECELR
jgi:hypothetical protein